MCFTLYDLLWGLGYANRIRYGLVLAEWHYAQYCTPVSMQSQKLPWGYSPTDCAVLIRDFNAKLAVASINGILYTDFMYDAIGFDNDGSFWATFNHNSDGYEPQIDGFFIAPALENNKWRLVDNHGTPLTSAIYDEIEPPYNGINLRARIGRKWSTLDMSGLYLIKLNGGWYY